MVDLTSDAFPLLGGRLDYADQRTIAALVYRHRQHIINLFLWPTDGGASNGGVSAASPQGYHVIHWSRGGMTYWAVFDPNPEDLKPFGDLAQRRGAAGGVPE